METILPIMNQFSEIETCVEVQLFTFSPNFFLHVDTLFAHYIFAMITWFFLLLLKLLLFKHACLSDFDVYL